jgi:hypothetical protein
MAKPKPEKKPADATPATRRILPMRPSVRRSHRRRDWRVRGRRPAVHDRRWEECHVRVKRVDNAEVTMIRAYSAHERITVKRASTEEGKR